MLIEFKVSNHKSIREEQVFSLVASSDKKSCEENVIKQGELPGMKGVRYLKGAAVYGANASGKSTLVQALQFMATYVGSCATGMKPDSPTGRNPFRLDNFSAQKPTTFAVTFVASEVRYQYGFSVNDVEVVEEYLIAYPKGSAQKWFHRGGEGVDEWAASSYFKGHAGLQEKTRKNALFLSVGAVWNHPQLSPVYEWFAGQLKFLGLSCFEFLSPTFTLDRISQNDEYKERIWKLMQSADLGLRGVMVEDLVTPAEQYRQEHPERAHTVPDNAENVKELLNLFFEHRVGDEKFYIEQGEESAGTRRFFAMLGPWLEILANGYTVFVDEIDTSLHPVLVREILKMLFSDKCNHNGAQVVFTTHNPTLLDQNLIRRDQVWFTEKDQEGATHLYPLTDYSPRQGEALAKGYLSGRYGAIPFIDGGLRFDG